MKWEGILQKLNEARTVEGVENDPFQVLADRARAKGGSVVRITAMARRSFGYGEIVASVNVSIECPQSEAYMDLAAELAFKKALEYSNDGFSLLVPDAPRLGEG